MRTILLALILALLCGAALYAMGRKEAPEKEAHEVVNPNQGISGKVEVWEGNFMPMIDSSKRENQITPAAGRRVRLHEPVRAAPDAGGPARDSVATPLIAETVTSEQGEFFLGAAPGTYSIFVEEGTGWYNNGWSSEGIQGKVVVEPDSVTNILIKITSKATF